MIENRLEILLKEAQIIRDKNIDNGTANFLDEYFKDLSSFIMKKSSSSLFKKQNIKVIVNHFDEILPFITTNNSNILFLYSDLYIKEPTFKSKFIEGLKKYPYKEDLAQIFYSIRTCLGSNPEKYEEFMDEDILDTLSELHLSVTFNHLILDTLNEDRQKYFLETLAKNKCNIPYNGIEYKGNNKEFIYNNLDLFMENSLNLYDLMKFVKDKPKLLTRVKEYIDKNEDKAFDSIFQETEHMLKMKDNTLKEVIKLTIKDIMKNENVNFSDITYNGGGLSRVLLIGDKVLKLGNRVTKEFPNNPYIISPLLRRELESNDEKCFIEVTERVDTENKVSKEELYELYKNIRNLGLKWTDIKPINVGRLRKENVIHWNQNLNPSEEVLGLTPKRGDKILKENDLVILDADFIYDENDPNINYLNEREIYNEFESRYQKELRDLSNEEVINEEEITQEKRR